jgi:ornithine cyclodeaminase/alanine dehydrogenase-like protein (mu-crystallin family)
MRIRALDARTIRGLISYEELIPLMRTTLAAVSRGDAELPLRRALQLPGDGGMLVMMPGNLGSEASAGIKLVSLVPNAATAGRSGTRAHAVTLAERHALGIAAEDIALAAHVYRKAERLGLGQMVEL